MRAQNNINAIFFIIIALVLMFSQQKSSHPFGLIFTLLPKIKTVIDVPAGNYWFSRPHDIQIPRQKNRSERSRRATFCCSVSDGLLLCYFNNILTLTRYVLMFMSISGTITAFPFSLNGSQFFNGSI